MSNDPRTLWRSPASGVHMAGRFVIVHAPAMQAEGVSPSVWRSKGYSTLGGAAGHCFNQYDHVVATKSNTDRFGTSLPVTSCWYFNHLWTSNSFYMVAKKDVPWESSSKEEEEETGRDPRILRVFNGWPVPGSSEPPRYRDKDWALIRCSDVPEDVYRGQMTGQTDIHKPSSVQKMFECSSYPYVKGPEAGDLDPVVVLLDDLRRAGWVVDVIKPGAKRSIPDYPHRCLSCNDRVYIGLFEVIHERNGSACNGRVY